MLRATFPAGTVSGAPKIRALEVIRELEPIKRNVYAGSIGYIGWHGDADTAIAIRTAVIQDGRLHVQAGAGIVHDSDPAEGVGGDDEQGPGVVPRGAEAARGPVTMTMLLMIDNYDSFTYNLVQYLQTLGAEVKVVRNDELTVDADRRARAGAHRDLAGPVHAERGGRVASR